MPVTRLSSAIRKTSGAIRKGVWCYPYGKVPSIAREVPSTRFSAINKGSAVDKLAWEARPERTTVEGVGYGDPYGAQVGGNRRKQYGWHRSMGVKGADVLRMALQ